ncbi:MAG: glycosyltransferase family 2 protein, partial [Boseongicola sp.]
VSHFSFSLTPVRHHLRYLDSGVWSQTGGQFGRSVRSGPRFRWCRFAERVKEEIRRVEMQRGIDET